MCVCVCVKILLSSVSTNAPLLLNFGPPLTRAIHNHMNTEQQQNKKENKDPPPQKKKDDELPPPPLSSHPATQKI